MYFTFTCIVDGAYLRLSSTKQYHVMKVPLFTQKNSIFAAIAFTILLIVLSTFLAFYGRYLAQQFSKVKEGVDRSAKHTDNIFTFMSDMDKSVRGYLVVPNERFLDPYRTVGELISPNFDTLQTVLEEHGFSSMATFVKAEVALDTYHDDLGEIVGLKKQGNEEQALKIYAEDRGGSIWGICNAFATEARMFEQARYQEAENHYQRHLDLVALMQALLLFVGVPTLLFVIYRINNLDHIRQKLFQDLEASRQKYLFSDKAAIETKNERNIIERLINNLETASDFIKNISKEDYSAEWRGLNENNLEDNRESLAGELIAMRDQMKQVKEEDQRRLWKTEGLSRVAEITRKDQEDPQKLADHVISYLVKYVDANQGALYFLEEDNPEERYLFMVACYAYDKKKFAEKKIAIGQGLVGQTFVEAKTLHLTKIPADYVAITSGLGEATPSSLLIIPLKFNEQIVGVIELASFSFFQPYQIKFLEEVGEIIASSFATVQINAKTKMLLEQSQQQAEEMRAQEEEVRQNMEELQATQEQMQRRTQELENSKENLEQKQEEIEQVRLVQQKRAEEQIKARNKMLAQAMEKAKQRETALRNEINELRTKINEPL